MVGPARLELGRRQPVQPHDLLVERARQRIGNLAREAEALRAALASNASQLRAELRAARLPLTPEAFGPIVSVILGPNERVMSAAEHLRSVGILVQAVRPPTVPIGAARLRLTVKATFTSADITRLARAVAEACAS